MQRRRALGALGLFEAILEDEALIDWAQSDAVRSDRALAHERAVIERAEALFEALCEEVATRRERRPEVLAMCRAYVWQMRARQRLGSARAELYERLITLPLWRDGERQVSTFELMNRAEVRGSLEAGYGAEVIVVEDAAELEALRGAIAPTPLRVIARSEDPAARQDDAATPAAARDAATRRSLEEAARAERLEALGGLVEQVIDEVCGDRVSLRDPVKTRAVQIVEMAQGAALARADGIWLGAESASVRAFVERGEALWLLVVVSQAYSALNAYEEQVTDQHEVEFLVRLARYGVTPAERAPLTPS